MTIKKSRCFFSWWLKIKLVVKKWKGRLKTNHDGAKNIMNGRSRRYKGLFNFYVPVSDGCQVLPETQDEPSFFLIFLPNFSVSLKFGKQWLKALFNPFLADARLTKKLISVIRSVTRLQHWCQYLSSIPTAAASSFR